jgi:hypothetical protein
MNAKLATTCFAIAALLLPIAGFTVVRDRPLPVIFARDFMTTARIRVELAAENLSTLVRIKVRTSNKGVVTLGGTAKSRDAAYKAVSIALSVDGVSGVEDHIKIMVRN